MHLRYDTTAAKRTVSVTLNSDLYAKAREAGLNVSGVAERAILDELDRRLRDRIRDEVRRDIEALDEYVAEHGSFAEMMREYQDAIGDDDAV